jgi:AhpD family alkylhydroperoxidase
MPGGRLRRRETELVILRVAHRRGCSYEFEHHRHLGAKAGVTAADLDAVTGEATPSLPGWTARERAILAAVDQLLDDHDVDDATWSRLAGELDERELIELVMLVGHYDMLATTIATLRIEPDRPRRG